MTDFEHIISENYTGQSQIETFCSVVAHFKRDFIDTVAVVQLEASLITWANS